MKKSELIKRLQESLVYDDSDVKIRFLDDGESDPELRRKAIFVDITDVIQRGDCISLEVAS